MTHEDMSQMDSHHLDNFLTFMAQKEKTPLAKQHNKVANNDYNSNNNKNKKHGEKPL